MTDQTENLQQSPPQNGSLTDDEIVEHFKHSGQKHVFKVFNTAIKEKEKRLVKQLSHLSQDEMEALIDKIETKSKVFHPTWKDFVKSVAPYALVAYLISN